MIRFDILTLFPPFFDSPFQSSILAKAFEKKLTSVHIHNIRDFTHDRHRTADDIPYGGGPGMVLKPEPVTEAIESVLVSGKKSRRIYFSPQGRPLKQQHLSEYLQYDQLILLCGHYEGVDERVIEQSIDEEISIGDYVLTGGEIAALVFVDAITRLIPGVLGCAESLESESFTASSSSLLLEYPQYTRPADFRGLKVPEVLLSGNHAHIDTWRREQALLRTQSKRPDLLNQPYLPQKKKKIIQKKRIL